MEEWLNSKFKVQDLWLPEPIPGFDESLKEMVRKHAKNSIRSDFQLMWLSIVVAICQYFNVWMQGLAGNPYDGIVQILWVMVTIYFLLSAYGHYLKATRKRNQLVTAILLGRL